VEALFRQRGIQLDRARPQVVRGHARDLIDIAEGELQRADVPIVGVERLGARVAGDGVSAQRLRFREEVRVGIKVEEHVDAGEIRHGDDVPLGAVLTDAAEPGQRLRSIERKAQQALGIAAEL
jgi:hypothetical protein